MGQQQGKQGFPAPPEGVALGRPPAPVSRIKGLKPRTHQSTRSPLTNPQPLGAHGPSGTALGIFVEHNGENLEINVEKFMK
jgi:hypothetical protein